MATFFPGPQGLNRNPSGFQAQNIQGAAHTRSSFTHLSLLSGFSFSETPNSPSLFISPYWSQAPFHRLARACLGTPFSLSLL